MFADEILGPIRQWGYLVKDLDEAMQCWVGQLGIGPWWGYRNVPVTATIDGVDSAVIMSVGLAYHQGMQIELIHQTNDAASPYRYFYDTDDAQVLQQIAYMVPSVAAAISQCEARGMHETARISTGGTEPYVYMTSTAMQGICIELMLQDEGFMQEYQRCAAEAAEWDGSEPYRLITL
jgi:hypothetical protein